MVHKGNLMVKCLLFTKPPFAKNYFTQAIISLHNSIFKHGGAWKQVIVSQLNYGKGQVISATQWNLYAGISQMVTQVLYKTSGPTYHGTHKRHGRKFQMSMMCSSEVTHSSWECFSIRIQVVQVKDSTLMIGFNSVLQKYLIIHWKWNVITQQEDIQVHLWVFCN